MSDFNVIVFAVMVWLSILIYICKKKKEDHVSSKANVSRLSVMLKAVYWCDCRYYQRRVCVSVMMGSSHKMTVYLCESQCIFSMSLRAIQPFDGTLIRAIAWIYYYKWMFIGKRDDFNEYRSGGQFPCFCMVYLSMLEFGTLLWIKAMVSKGRPARWPIDEYESGEGKHKWLIAPANSRIFYGVS